MDQDSKEIATGSQFLKSRSDWPYWFPQFRVIAREKDIWHECNPDAPDVKSIHEQKPTYPSLPVLPPVPKEPVDKTDTAAVSEYELLKAEYETSKAVLAERLKTQDEEFRRYNHEQRNWDRKRAALNNVMDWVRKTVAAGILGPAQIQLEQKGLLGMQPLIRHLKRSLAPNDATVQNHIRIDYQLHLAKARTGRMTPEKWFAEWEMLFVRAEAFGIPDVVGSLALTDFLDALAPKYAIDWAKMMRANMIADQALGREPITLQGLAQIFSSMLHEDIVQHQKGKNYSVFATPSLSGQAAQDGGTGGSGGTPGTGKPTTCPCKPNSNHRWKPISCLRLQEAVTGSAPGPSLKLSGFDKKKIKERYNQAQWKELRDQVEKTGWKTRDPADRETSNEGTSVGQINAVIIDPGTLPKGPVPAGVYSTTYSAHPFADCTIFDGGSAVHVVNSQDLLVPGTFVKSRSDECVHAGTQSLPVTGTGTRVFPCLFNAPNGRKYDLQLHDVKVVEGFHLSIVSEARLKEKAKVWHLGLDHTLRHGSITANTVMFKLINKHNLLFIEYKPRSYSSVPILVKAVAKRSWIPQVRSDPEDLWHLRAGHLGQRALQALVKNAQNVNIEGTPRLHCPDCATTHASQVISRRPKERSPRPFYRISWDLFDMPRGRLGEQWSLAIKDDFSGKIENNNLHSKTLPEIMRAVERYYNRVLNKYMRIVEIHQDSDSATLPWRGRSRYEEWASDKGITIKATPSHTHEPNGSAERAGQELITKGIKMRASARLPEKLWPEIMDAAAWLHGMSPSAIHGYRSPNEVLDSWFRQYFRWYEPAHIRARLADLRPDWSGVYAYGCRAYPLDRDRAAGIKKRTFKVTPRGHVGYLVGYRASNIYRIWVPILDQVITTRNVSFNEARFYNENSEVEMSKADAVMQVELLHDGELDVLEGFDLEERPARLGPATESILGGEPIMQTDTVAGRPSDQEAEQAETTRSAGTASQRLRIREDRDKEQRMLVTPDATPEPEFAGSHDQQLDDRSLGTGSRLEMHLPERADPPSSSDRIGSHPGDHRSHSRAVSSDLNDTDEPEHLLAHARQRLRRATPDPPPRSGRTTAVPLSRASRRLAGTAPEVDRPLNIYPAIRKTRRKRPDRDDQMGGGDNGGVHALIADLEYPEDQWRDFQETFVPGAAAAWMNKKSYKPLNAVVMAATLSQDMPVASVKDVRVHMNELPPPPTTWKQLINHPLRPMFENASRKEINTLRSKGTWTEQPIGDAASRPLPLKWVWTYKFNQDGFLDRAKARIVVRGDLQEKDTLQSTYAATLAAKSFRTAMAIAAYFDLEIMQYDVVGAFLNAMITAENPVVCELPDGFREPGMCVKLNRALYGLRDSPLLWYEEFASTLRNVGLMAAKEEPCLFFTQDRKVLILFYVDDILLLYHKDREQEAQALWVKIASKYEVQEQGPVQWFLGIRVIRNRADRTITLIHDTYIDKITRKFGLNDGSFPPTPLPSEELIKNTGEATKQEIKTYQEKVGSALYTAIMLRPDVAFAVSKLSHFLINPSEQHLKAVDRVIMYLYRTRFEAIQYGHYNGPDLVVCGDASFADDPDTRRSSHGYIAMLFGGAILWKAARQSTVTTSTTEAELLALEHTAKESMALKRFFKELTLNLGDLWTIWCDNQQTIRLVVGKNERITTRLRHIDIQNMWLRQEHAKGSFTVEYLQTSSMPADGLTKPLTQQQFEKFKRQLNLQDASSMITRETRD